MMSTDRLSEEYVRTSGGRTRKPTFVIATEGEKTEPDYFTYLARAYQDINIIPLPASDGHSQPRQVLNKLLSWKVELTKEEVESYHYWIVIDHDRRPRPNLERVMQDAKDNDVSIADSMPCFEAWLIQHFCKLSRIAKDSRINQVRRCRYLINRHLKRYDPNYKKGRLDSAVYLPKVKSAIENAEFDEVAASGKDEFAYMGSRVHKLVKAILSGGGAAQAR